MRILYFTRDYTTHDRRFLLALRNRGLEVHYLRLEDDGEHYEARLLPTGVQQVAWRGGAGRVTTLEGCLGLMPDLMRVIEGVHPDLVHAGPLQSCGFMAALANRHPLVIMSWGSDVLVEADRSPLSQWLTGYVLAQAQLFACDCAAVAKKAQGYVPLPDGRIIIFPWGLERKQPAAQTRGEGLALRRSLGWEGHRVVLSMRAWEPIYGVDVVLEAFRQASAEDASLRLLLLGSGSMHEGFRRFIECHGLGARIHSPGLVAHEETAAYFGAADVYVSAAHSDGTSISLLEAMAYGLPPVVTDIASNREWVEEGFNGWLVTDGDAEELAARMLDPTDDTITEVMAARNRVIIAERADWERNIDRLVVAYSALKGSSKGARLDLSESFRG